TIAFYYGNKRYLLPTQHLLEVSRRTKTLGQLPIHHRRCSCLQRKVPAAPYRWDGGYHARPLLSNDCLQLLKRVDWFRCRPFYFLALLKNNQLSYRPIDHTIRNHVVAMLAFG